MTKDNYWLRATSGRVNRRKFVGGAAFAGLGAASMALVGCGGGNSGSKLAVNATSTPSAQPTLPAKPGGTYNTAFTGPFAGVDPHNSVYGGAGILPMVYNYLFRMEVAPDAAAAKGIQYDLASSYKLEADNITYTFKLRNDVKVAANKNGVPERVIDSSDVKANWDRISDPKVGAIAYSQFHGWVDKYDTPDKQTVRLIMKKPYAWTEAVVGSNLRGAIVPQEWLANANLKKDTVGGGPFTLTQLTEGQIAQMDKNPTYYRQGRPYLDSYVIKSFADQTTYRTAFQSKQIDVYGPTNHDENLQLKQADNTLESFSDPSLGFLSFWMNTRMKPWDDPRVRRATNLATNRQEYIDVIGHGVGQAIAVLTYAFKEALPADEVAKIQPFDVATAKQLFSAAGVTQFNFQYPTSSNTPDYMNIFVRQMQAAGVTATPQPLDAATWVAQYYQNKLSAHLAQNQTYSTPDVAIGWHHTNGIYGNNTYDTGFSDPAVDTAIDTAAGTLDPAARLKAYQDAQRLIQSKDPAVWHFFGVRSEAVAYPYVMNFPAGLGALGTAFINDVWLNK